MCGPLNVMVSTEVRIRLCHDGKPRTGSYNRKTFVTEANE